jgi:hypothetical protein
MSGKIIPEWATGFNFVPKLLVKGVASNGREYDLMGFADWIADERIDRQILQRGTMTRREIRSLWEWSGRTDSMPKTLTLHLAANPEYFRWILIADVFKFLSAKLTDDAETIKNRLVKGFADKAMRTCCDYFEPLPNGGIKAHGVRIHTADLMRWAAREYALTIKLSDLFPEDGPTSVLGLLWPKYDYNWPALDGDGDGKMCRLYQK